MSIEALRTAIQQPVTTDPVAWVSKTGHGTYFRESITPELASLEHGGLKMWRPLTYTDTHPAPGVLDNTACKSVQKRLEAQQPATGEPVKVVPYNPTTEMMFSMKGIDPALSLNQCRELWSVAWKAAPTNHPAPGVPEFSRIANRKLDELQEQGFAITGYAIQRGPVRGFIDGGGFVGWWQGEPDPGVSDDVVRDAERYRWLKAYDHNSEDMGICKWVDEGWSGQWVLEHDPDTSIDAAMLAASPAQKGGE